MSVIGGDRRAHSDVTVHRRLTSRPLSCLRHLVAIGMLATGCGPPGTPGLEIFPKHFLLRPGEQIHYQVLERTENGQSRFAAPYEFSVGDPKIVRLIEPTGLFEAMGSGQTELVVRTPTSEQRVRVEVAGGAQPPMMAVHHTTLPEIVAKELLFVGHANLDGFDHTAVAKLGIDRLVHVAKTNGWPVVYWVSKEYPHWYTADRNPDFAIISEGQEHRVRVDAQRVTFAGGSFMFCLLRNVQMTLHGMVKHNGAERIHFVLPAQAIWVEDIWGPGDKRPYPAPMVLLTRLFERAEPPAPRPRTSGGRRQGSCGAER
jgi:hypothetical protein